MRNNNKKRKNLGDGSPDSFWLAIDTVTKRYKNMNEGKIVQAMMSVLIDDVRKIVKNGLHNAY